MLKDLEKLGIATVRVIPRLDIKGPNLVKGIHLEGLRVLGRPEQFAQHYYEQGADELMYIDVVASLYNRNSLHEIISRTAKEIFIPLTVGGGLRTIDDIRSVLRAGADKVSLNTAAHANPEVVRAAAQVFGSSTIVIGIEAVKQPAGDYHAFTDNGRQATGREVVSWAQQVEALGAGEIVLTSVDKEGTGEGFDLELTQKVASAVSIPVIAHGGAGSLSHVAAAIEHGCADAVFIASMFHYGALSAGLIGSSDSKEGNVEFKKSGSLFRKFSTATIPELKRYLVGAGIPCRGATPSVEASHA